MKNRGDQECRLPCTIALKPADFEENFRMKVQVGDASQNEEKEEENECK